MKVYSNNVYIINKDNQQSKYLILYNVSGNHYVGIKVEDTKENYGCFLQVINKYAIFSSVSDISRKDIKSPVYFKGKVMAIDDATRNFVNKNVKKYLISNLDANLSHRISEDLSCLKWYDRQVTLNKHSINECEYSQLQICWFDFGFGVGSELRKLRPALLWRSSSDKKMWTVIPLSTKCKQDNYYFHYDLTSVNDCSIKIESMMNYSYKRIVGAYYSKNIKAFINKEDYNNTKAIIKRYYSFEGSLENNNLTS